VGQKHSGGSEVATKDDLRREALSLAGTVETRHFDRTAFRVNRIYVTLAADGITANFKFSPDDQEFKCLLAPDVFSPVPNAWGKRGWTMGRLSALSKEELASAVKTAWAHALPKKTKGRVGSAAPLETGNEPTDE
jgi:hypothetical protein